MKLKNSWPEIIAKKRLDQDRKKTTGTEKISEVDFGSRNYTFIKKKPVVSSFEKVEHKN